jgi:hypothetical protein
VPAYVSNVLCALFVCAGVHGVCVNSDHEVGSWLGSAVGLQVRPAVGNENKTHIHTYYIYTDRRMYMYGSFWCVDPNHFTSIRAMYTC